MNRLLFALVAIVAIVTGLLVGTLNADHAALDLLWVQLDWPLGLLILMAFAGGLLAGLLLAWLGWFLPLKWKLRRLQSAATNTNSNTNTNNDLKPGGVTADND